MPGYDGSLLRLAVDLTDRFMPAFETPTGVPLSWVNLRHVRPAAACRLACSRPASPCSAPGCRAGEPATAAEVWVPPPLHAAAAHRPRRRLCRRRRRLQGQIPGDVRSTCTACAGTLLLEFGVLSRLTGNATYEAKARHAVETIFAMRSPRGLVGNTLDCDSGAWVRTDAGVGAGVDSFYEYLLKVGVWGVGWGGGCTVSGRLLTRWGVGVLTSAGWLEVGRGGVRQRTGGKR